VEKVEPAKTGTSPTELLPDAFLQPGAWALGESNWKLAVATLSDADDPRLRSLGERVETESKPADLETKFLTWLRTARATRLAGCRVYDRPLGRVQVRAVTEERQGRERLRLAQLFWREGNTVHLLEASLATAAGRTESEAGHLLPLPKGSTSLARRWDPSGALSCEILGLPSRPEEALAAWTAAGWSVQDVPASGTALPLRILRRDGKTINACAIEAVAKKGETYFLLSTQPAPSSGEAH
jgi:hypothetical protein